MDNEYTRLPHSKGERIKMPTEQLVEILSKNTNVLRLEIKEYPRIDEIVVDLCADIGFEDKAEMDRAKNLLLLMGAHIEEAKLEHQTEDGRQVLHSEGNNVLHIEIKKMKPHIKEMLIRAGVEFSEK